MNVAAESHILAHWFGITSYIYIDSRESSHAVQLADIGKLGVGVLDPGE